MSVTLVSGATTVTLPNPSRDYPVQEIKRQVLGRSAGGTVYTYDKGVDTYEVELHWELLSTANKTNLTSFFHTTMDGITTTFTYTDSSGNSYTARFLNPTLEFQERMRGCYSLRLRLELSAIHA